MSALVPTTVPRDAWTGSERIHVLAILDTNWTQQTLSAAYVSVTNQQKEPDNLILLSYCSQLIYSTQFLTITARNTFIFKIQKWINCQHAISYIYRWKKMFILYLDAEISQFWKAIICIFTAENECSTEEKNTCDGGSETASCAVSNGQVYCGCPSGYALNASKYCIGGLS